MLLDVSPHKFVCFTLFLVLPFYLQCVGKVAWYQSLNGVRVGLLRLLPTDLAAHHVSIDAM